jgi:triphosphoribosyl-dephospho-CoA synthetase
MVSARDYEATDGTVERDEGRPSLKDFSDARAANQVSDAQAKAALTEQIDTMVRTYSEGVKADLAKRAQELDEAHEALRAPIKRLSRSTEARDVLEILDIMRTLTAAVETAKQRLQATATSSTNGLRLRANKAKKTVAAVHLKPAGRQ